MQGILVESEVQEPRLLSVLQGLPWSLPLFAPLQPLSVSFFLSSTLRRGWQVNYTPSCSDYIL